MFKERPIIFSESLIPPILSGDKTQTRRIVKNIPAAPPGQGQYRCIEGGTWGLFRSWDNLLIEEFKCPYGKVDDQLWGREAFAYYNHKDEYIKLQGVVGSNDPDYEVIYRANIHEEISTDVGIKWRPSIHMPRWASRIQLEITDIRVERLSDISEEDAKAEGVKYDFLNSGPPKHGRFNCEGEYKPAFGEFDPYRFEFSLLWEAINGKGSWAENPWVWVIIFKRIV